MGPSFVKCLRVVEGFILLDIAFSTEHCSEECIATFTRRLSSRSLNLTSYNYNNSSLVYIWCTIFGNFWLTWAWHSWENPEVGEPLRPSHDSLSLFLAFWASAPAQRSHQLSLEAVQIRPCARATDCIPLRSSATRLIHHHSFASSRTDPHTDRVLRLEPCQWYTHSWQFWPS